MSDTTNTGFGNNAGPCIHTNPGFGDNAGLCVTTPIAGKDPSLFEAALNDRMLSGRVVAIHITSPRASATVFGTIQRSGDHSGYRLQDRDQLSSVYFDLDSIETMFDTSIFLKSYASPK